MKREKKVKEEVEKINWNVSARVFCPEEEKKEMKSNTARAEDETI